MLGLPAQSCFAQSNDLIESRASHLFIQCSGASASETKPQNGLIKMKIPFLSATCAKSDKNYQRNFARVIPKKEHGTPL